LSIYTIYTSVLDDAERKYIRIIMPGKKENNKASYEKKKIFPQHAEYKTRAHK
jgi:hypothetical protein